MMAGKGFQVTAATIDDNHCDDNDDDIGEASRADKTRPTINWYIWQRARHRHRQYVSHVVLAVEQPMTNSPQTVLNIAFLPPAAMCGCNGGQWRRR